MVLWVQLLSHIKKASVPLIVVALIPFSLAAKAEGTGGSSYLQLNFEQEDGAESLQAPSSRASNAAPTQVPMGRVSADPPTFFYNSTINIAQPPTETMAAPESVGGSGFTVQSVTSKAPRVVGPPSAQPPLQPGVYPPVLLPPLKPQKPQMTPSFRKGCGGYPICDPFYAELKACEPTCEPVGYHSRRNDPGSCHHSGRAIDVFGIKCADTGRTYYAINNGRYEDLVRCVKRRKRIKVLWKNGPGRTSGHRDHAHFSVSCRGGSYW